MKEKLLGAFFVTMALTAVLGWGRFMVLHWDVVLLIFAMVLAVIQMVSWVVDAHDERE